MPKPALSRASFIEPLYAAAVQRLPKSPTPAPTVVKPRTGPVDPGRGRDIFIDGLDAYSAGNYPRARSLYDKACQMGSATGCEYFANMLSAGRGGPQDVAGARALLDRTCKEGHVDSCARLAAMPGRDADIPSDAQRGVLKPTPDRGSAQRMEATKNFRYEGLYAFETTIDGVTTAGRCTVSYGDTGANQYFLHCRHKDGDVLAHAAQPLSGYLEVFWPAGLSKVIIRYQVDESDPNALTGSVSGNVKNKTRLVRTGNLVPIASFPVKGTNAFTSSVRGVSDSGKCTITTDETRRPHPFLFDSKVRAARLLRRARSIVKTQYSSAGRRDPWFLLWLEDMRMPPTPHVRSWAGTGTARAFGWSGPAMKLPRRAV